MGERREKARREKWRRRETRDGDREILHLISLFGFPSTHLSLLRNIDQTELISIFPQSSAFCLFFSISLLYIAVVGPVDPILARICRFWRFSFLLRSLSPLS